MIRRTFVQVLSVQLFFMDYFDYYQYRVDDPGEILENADTPIYLLAWCQSRHAPRCPATIIKNFSDN